MTKCSACGTELKEGRDWNPEIFGTGEVNPITHYYCPNSECKGWKCFYCDDWHPFGISCSVAMVKNVRRGSNFQDEDRRGHELWEKENS